VNKKKPCLLQQGVIKTMLSTKVNKEKTLSSATRSNKNPALYKRGKRTLSSATGSNKNPVLCSREQ
jgi:hypothetical protein